MRLFMLLTTMVVTLFCSCGRNTNYEKTKAFEDKGIKFHQMIAQRNLEEALAYSDTLITEYPEYPEFYFMRGWVFDQLNDTVKKREAFMSARKFYDKRLANSNSLYDAINRAFVTQILFGMDAYRKETDSLKLHRHEDFEKDPGAKWIVDSINYELVKDELFNTGVVFITRDSLDILLNSK